MDHFIPHLTIETLDNGCIRLENESMGDSYAVDVHPIHVRLLAEMAGLCPKNVRSEPDNFRTAAAILTAEALARRLRTLHSRIVHLAEYLRDHSDHQHADLTYETDYASILADLSAAFIADMDGGETQSEPTGNPDETPGFPVAANRSCNAEVTPAALQPANTPETGAVEQPQKRGHSEPEQMPLEA